jgi:multiple sugar transport system permease protein
MPTAGNDRMTATTASPSTAVIIPTPWSVRLMPYMLLAPAVLVTLFIVFFPMVQALITSFYDLILWKPNASRFVGFGNYVKLFADPVFWTALGRASRSSR